MNKLWNNLHKKLHSSSSGPPQSSVPARQKYSFKNTQTRVASDHRNLTYCVNRQTDKGSRSRESDKELNASFSLCCLRATICVSTAPASLALCHRSRPPPPEAEGGREACGQVFHGPAGCWRTTDAVLELSRRKQKTEPMWTHERPGESQTVLSSTTCSEEDFLQSYMLTVWWRVHIQDSIFFIKYF